MSTQQGLQIKNKYGEVYGREVAAVKTAREGLRVAQPQAGTHHVAIDAQIDCSSLHKIFPAMPAVLGLYCCKRVTLLVTI